MTDFRYLTEAEKDLAREIFGSSLNYDIIKIYAGKYLDTDLLSVPHSVKGNIYYPSEYTGSINILETSIDTLVVSDESTFIHEMTHVWQSQNNVNVELTKASDLSQDYDYQAIFDNGGSFENLSLEQQGQFVQHYYLVSKGETLPSSVQDGITWSFSEWKFVPTYASLTAHTLEEFQAKLPSSSYFDTPTFNDDLYIMQGEQTGAYANGEGANSSIELYEVRLALIGDDDTPVLHGHTTGFTYDSINPDLLLNIIETGAKSEKIAASWDLYRVIEKYGTWDSNTGLQSLGDYTIQQVVNQFNGLSYVVSHNGQAVNAIAYYGSDDFQQQVLEIIGADGRTTEAEILVADGVVEELFRGEPIEIQYPENFVFTEAGGFIGNIIGQQISNGNIYHDILWQSGLKTVGENVGTFLDLVAQDNSLLESIFDPIFGVNGTNQPRPDILDDFLGNFHSTLSSIVGNLIVQELGDAIGIEGIGGEVFDVAVGTVTTGIVQGGLGLVFDGLDSTVYSGILAGNLSLSDTITVPDVSGGEVTVAVGDYLQFQVFNAVAAYAGGRLAGEVIEPESEIAGIFGAVGSAYAAAVGTAVAGNVALSTAITSAFSSASSALAAGAAAGSIVPIIGTAIGAFVGTVLGTAFGNLFGGDDDLPSAYARIGYDNADKAYEIYTYWDNDGGDSAVAVNMANQVAQGVNDIITATYGTLRQGVNAPNMQIGYEGGTYIVDIAGLGEKSFNTSVDAINYSAFHLMKSFDLVGGHAVVMRAWHNSDATNIYEFKEDIEVAEAFQVYLANPTGILAMMMNEPESELAQSWAAILQRAAELELHLPHEKDLDGGWGAILQAQNADPSLIPDIAGDTIILTDPVTGEETIIHHAIGPGYEIVRIEGTDGNDIIEVMVDGPSITYVEAGAGDDVLIGSEQSDILVGGSGDDQIDGNGGNDWLHGGAGNDNIDGGAGEDFIIGSDGNDVLIGGSEDDTIYGNGGDDYLNAGSSGNDFLYGGDGNDVIYGNGYSIFYDPNQVTTSHLNGGNGDDILHGFNHDILNGGPGNDEYQTEVWGYGNTFVIARGAGHDVINSSLLEYNTLYFNETIGHNELYFTQSGNDLKILVLGEDQSVTVKNYFSSSYPLIHIAAHNGKIIADGRSQILQAVANDSTIPEVPQGQYNVISDAAFAAGTHDMEVSNNVWADTYGWFTWGTDGADNLVTSNEITAGGAGNDYIQANGIAGFRFYGDTGNDTIHGGGLRDTLIGGLGDDTIYGHNDVDLIFGGYGVDHIYGGDGVDNMHGGAGNDFMYGQAGDDAISGDDGDDYIEDYEGINTIRGGAGNDTITTALNTSNNKLYGDEGDDTITGGDGIDTIHGDVGNDTLAGGAGDDWLDGADGNDIITGGTGNDVLIGSDGEDTLQGGEDNDRLYGGNEIDDLQGGLGDDLLFGEDGDDQLSGDEGQDILSGGLGDDTLDGGAGDDEAVFSGKYSYYTLNGSTITDDVGNEGTDTLISIERLVFADGVYENGIFTPTGGTPNTAPVATGDSYSGEQDAPITGNVLDNDSDADGDALSVTAGTIATAHGSVTIAANGNFTYTPDAGYIGSDSFTYTLEDGNGGSDMGSVSLTLSAFTGIVGTSGDDNLVGTTGDDVIHGLAGNDFLSGEDGNDTLKGEDGNDTLKGRNGDDIMYGGNGADYLEGNSGADILYGGLGADTLKGSADVDTFAYLSAAEGGDTILDFNPGSGEKIDLTQVLINAPGFVDSNAFTGGYLRVEQNSADVDLYLDMDGTAGTGAETLLATLQGRDVSDITLSAFILPTSGGASNTAPVTTNDSFNGTEDTNVTGNVLGNDSDADGDALTVTSGTFSTTHGSVVVSGNGDFTYTPDANYNGADSFTYTVLDGNGGSDTGLVSVTLGAVNDNPVANDDSAQTDQNVAAIVNVLSNDNDIDGDNLTVSVVTAAAFGALVINADQTITYTPDAGYTGSDSFTYQVSDGNGGTDTATVSLTVNAVVTNTAPLAVDDSFTSDQDTNITGNVLGNDSDPDGDTLSVMAETVATAHGSVDILADGNFTYTPNTGYVGVDSFAYTLLDGNGGSDTANVNLTLNAVTADIVGTSSGETLTGTTGDDVIRGLGGNDFLSGEDGNDTLYGDDGDDTLKGRNGDDIFYGGAGDDYLEGNSGNDILYGGLGADTLKGSAGVDTFVFTSMAEAGDTINDFNPGSGEVIDIADLLIGYDPLSDAITDFVEITDDGTDSTLKVDSDGGANSFVTVATLLGVTGITDEAALETAGNLVTV